MWLNYFGAYTENLESTPESLQQNFHTDKILLHEHGAVFQKMGHVLWTLCQWIKNRQQIHPTTTEKSMGTHHRTWGRLADWSICGTTFVRWLWKIVKSMDRFSSYAFACQTMSEDSKMIARVIINLMTNNAYLPITIISDKGSTQGSSWRSMDHCRTYHEETCTYNWHVWKDACVKEKSNGNRNGWTMIVVVRVCQHCRTIYNTTYHTNIEWDLSRVFIRRIPHNVLDHRIIINSTETPILTSQGAGDIFLQTELIFPVVPKTPCKPTSNTKPTLTKNASKLRE